MGNDPGWEGFKWGFGCAIVCMLACVGLGWYIFSQPPSPETVRAQMEHEAVLKPYEEFAWFEGFVIRNYSSHTIKISELKAWENFSNASWATAFYPDKAKAIVITFTDTGTEPWVTRDGRFDFYVTAQNTDEALLQFVTALVYRQVYSRLQELPDQQILTSAQFQAKEASAVAKGLPWDQFRAAQGSIPINEDVAQKQYAYYQKWIKSYGLEPGPNQIPMSVVR